MAKTRKEDVGEKTDVKVVPEKISEEDFTKIKNARANFNQLTLQLQLMESQYTTLLMSLYLKYKLDVDEYKIDDQTGAIVPNEKK